LDPNCLSDKLLISQRELAVLLIQVERMAAKARKETEPFLAELAARAVELERVVRQLF
jgi:hypothetical protein